MNTIKPEAFIAINDESTVVLDVRRDSDYETSDEIIPNATWQNPATVDEWIDSVSKDKQVIIYCVRGGGVSISVVESLHKGGITARYIEGGIEGFKEAGGAVDGKS